MFELFKSLPRVVLVAALVVSGGACRRSDSSGTKKGGHGETTSQVSVAGVRQADPIAVVATVGMVADLVRHVGGRHVTVTQLMGPGVDPHLYKVTRDDVRSIFAADVIFASGLMLEGKMSHTLEQLGRRKRVALVADRMAEEGILEPLTEQDSAHLDPHAWMDLSIWANVPLMIAEVLAAESPSLRAEFLAAAESYREALLELHAFGQRALATVPPVKRHLITSHDAFGYFGRAYGLQVTGVQGISTDSEAGLLRVNRLVDLLVDREITAVFVESSVPRKSLEAVIEGAASRGLAVTIGGELYSDSCGPAGTYEGTYMGMMDHNLTLITRALGGDVPAGGFAGRLAIGGMGDE